MEYKNIDDFKKNLGVLIEHWLAHPKDAINDLLLSKDPYLELDPLQEEAVDAFALLLTCKMKRYYNEPMTDEEKRIAGLYGISIMSGKGIGKDAVISMICIVFLLCAPKCKAFVTGPNAETLRRVFFSEITKWLEGSKVESFIEQQDMLYYVKQPNKNLEKTVEFVRGTTVSVNKNPTAQAEALGGRHSPFMLWVVDEASAVKDPVFTPIETTMTQDVNIAVLIFNPTSDKGYAIDTHYKDSEHWITLQWDAEKSPRVSKSRIEKARKKYGEHSNHYRVYIKGLPPLTGDSSIFPYRWLTEAYYRNIVPSKNAREVWGVDIGGPGDDSVIMPRIEGEFLAPLVKNEPDPDLVESWIAENIYVREPKHVFIDPVNLGYSVFKSLEKRFKDVPDLIIPADFRKSPMNISRFSNKRAESFYELRDGLRKGLVSFDEGCHQLLVNELSHLTSFMSKSRGYNVVQLIGKRDLRSLGIPSPNQADAAALSLYRGLNLELIATKYHEEYDEEEIDYYRRAKKGYERASCWSAGTRI